jgi:predicted aldo/keto reductase-like oxidoreductase
MQKIDWIGGPMKLKSSRRRFLQAGLILPAAELITSRSLKGVSQAPAPVVYRTLGKTGLKVSGVGYGLGNYPLSDVITRCIDLGINYFDTARHYGGGLSERVFGTTIKGKRDKILISTKTGGTTKEAIFKDIDASLQTIGTDHVDVYLMAARDTPQRMPWRSSKNKGKSGFLAAARTIQTMLWTIS